MRTPEEFKAQAEKLGIKEWNSHKCMFCGYQCKYIFKNGEVFYDAGCDCVTYISDLDPRSWDDIAHYYNMQENEEVIKEFDQFWGFR